MDDEPGAWVEPAVAADVTSKYRAGAAAMGRRDDAGGLQKADFLSAPSPSSLESTHGLSFDNLWAGLSDYVGGAYSASERNRHTAKPQLLAFEHGPATYLFDSAAAGRVERTVLVLGRPTPPEVERDSTYQAGYPMPVEVGRRGLDRGHYIPYSGGGLFGPNIFVQDRALNRGWSRQGRLYRAMERRVVATEGALLLARPTYVDGTDIPFTVDLGVIDGDDWQVFRFRNRYDLSIWPPHAPREGPNNLEVVLNGAVSAQVGALGEETAAAFLEEELDATIVAMGDAAMPRSGAAQDLDLIALLDGELIAFEVKTKLLSKAAGRRTRAGNLTRPRMRRSPIQGSARQGSQAYVASRLGDVVDLGNDYAGIEVRVLAVDLCLMEVQQFTVNDSGTRLSPIGLPHSCLSAAQSALARIIEHRGYL